MREYQFCFMYDGVFYNLLPDAFSGTPIIVELTFGDKMTVFYDRDSAEAAKVSAYARYSEYEENGLEIPKTFELISELEIVPIDEDIWTKIDEMSFEVHLYGQ